MKIFKSFLYVVACGAVFFILAKAYNSLPHFTNSANAFEWEKQVSVYFKNKNMGSPTNCSKVFPVSRTILNAETFGPGAIEALLRGVSGKEKESGYFTDIGAEVVLNRFEIKNRMAYIDFDSSLNKNINACQMTSIKSQIENTLNSLPDIDSVVISINGKTKGVSEP